MDPFPPGAAEIGCWAGASGSGRRAIGVRSRSPELVAGHPVPSGFPRRGTSCRTLAATEGEIESFLEPENSDGAAAHFLLRRRTAGRRFAVGAGCKRWRAESGSLSGSVSDNARLDSDGDGDSEEEGASRE